MQPSKKSFFERLTGTARADDDDVRDEEEQSRPLSILEDSETEGQLTVDVYKTDDSIVVKAMIAGVKPEDLDINITRDMVTIKGKREANEDASDDEYFHRELYWGSFSRTITLPEEIEVEEAEAVERHGLLTIKLPKIDKAKQNKLKVKSV